MKNVRIPDPEWKNVRIRDKSSWKHNTAVQQAQSRIALRLHKKWCGSGSASNGTSNIKPLCCGLRDRRFHLKYKANKIALKNIDAVEFSVEIPGTVCV
jgi:hypothetical protein